MDWTPDIETVLENIRINAVILSKHHTARYYHYKGFLKYFKLPLIVLSSITSIASVGLTGYLKQNVISIITCLLSFLSAVIASVELYLGIQKSAETELVAAKNFLLLAYDIFKTLALSSEHRMISGKVYLDEKFQEYNKLVENAELTRNKLKDSLAPLPENIQQLPTPTPSTPSNSSIFEII